MEMGGDGHAKTTFVLAGILALILVACGGGGPTPTPFTGEWESHDRRDPITDEGEFRIVLNASETYARDYPSYHDWNSKASMHLSCSLEHAVPWILWPAIIVANAENVVYSDDVKEVVVDWRVDSEEPVKEIWLLEPTLIQDQSGKTYPPLGMPIIEDLDRADRIAVRVYTEDGEQQATAVFRPDGFSDAYLAIKETCPEEDW